MTQMQNAESFIKALEEAGISISNGAELLKALTASEDQNITLEKICVQGRGSHGITFTAAPGQDSRPLSKAFIDHGFDGFTFRTFVSNLKTGE